MVSTLSFEEVTYRYPGADEPALTGVDLAIAEGEFCVLAGTSASGKSTLLRAASGLVPHFHGGHFAGRVVVAGLDTREEGPGEIAAVAGTLLQDPETQVMMGTPGAELAFPLENRGHAPAQVARAVEEAALALGIGDLLERPVGELSGGELQRVALGAALAGRPRVVLLDEPTSQLDPVAGDELVWLLRRLNEEWGTTVVLAEHRLERCLAAADRVIALDGGRVACDAEPSAFLGWAQREAPALCTPGARLFGRLGIHPPPPSVKRARTMLADHGLLREAPSGEDGPAAEAAPRRRRRRRSTAGAALHLAGVWHEIAEGPAILRGLDLSLDRGETVALMGRNGAGKSTLLRHAGGLLEPTRGRVTRDGRVALLLQNPGDYFLHQRVGDEAPPEALDAVGLAALADRHPGEISGGERQRLALAVVMGAGDPPAVVCLDEPTRGMDRPAKQELANRLRALAAGGSAVLVATHDTEFAAVLAERVVLLARGRVIADGPAREVLAGGWYFATETARILGGEAGALLPEEGAEAIVSRAGVVVGG